MKQLVNEVYKPLFLEHPRYFILMGGRGAGRSTVASQFANAKLIDEGYFRCAIMRYILGDVRNSIYREIKDRAEENDIAHELKINDSLMTIQYGQNSINAVGFKKSSSDQKSKLKSLANYNCVIIEEADEIPEEDFMQLDDSLRTVKGDIVIILLLNCPPKNHWIIKRWFNLRKSEVEGFFIPELKPDIQDTVFIRTSYKDNEKNIAPDSIKQYENYRVTKPDHYYNMIKGLVPETVQGKIYIDWQMIDKLPHEARLISYGLDFGYSYDPSALVAIYYYNGGYIFDEVCYTKGLSNRQLADIILSRPAAPVIADSAEPKSIAELQEYGITILPATKGKGSVSQGIAFVQSQRVSYTKRSVNIHKEQDNYAWMIDKNGENTGVPKDIWNHAMDAIRYGMQIKSNVQPTDLYEQPPYQSPLESEPLVEFENMGGPVDFIPKRREQ